MAADIRRILRLWKLHARLDILWITRDTRMFVTWILSDIVLNTASLIGMLLLAERFSGIGAWTKAQIVFLLGFCSAANGLIEMFFSFNLGFISRRVGRGQLDHVLIQPQPLWMAFITEGFVPFYGSAVTAPGAVMMLWSAPRLGVAITPLWLLTALANLAASAAIVMAFQYTWGSLAFLSPRGAEEINTSTYRLMRQLMIYPLDGMGPALTIGLLTVVPVGFLGWYPARALLGLDHSRWATWVTPAAALIFIMIASFVFSKGLQHYGRTGSRRYSARGHRA